MAPISSERRTVRLSVRLSLCLSIHSVGSSVRLSVVLFARCVPTFLSFVASARSYPSASLRNGNAFCFSFTLSSTEGERARDSFNNPAARSEIYYFRTTLLDKSIWLTLSFFPFVSLRPTDERYTFSFLPFSFFSSSPARHNRAGPPASSRTSVQGDLIKRGRTTTSPEVLSVWALRLKFLFVTKKFREQSPREWDDRCGKLSIDRSKPKILKTSRR